MKNQLTTLAALPSGAGQAAHLAPEIGEPRVQMMAPYFAEAMDWPPITFIGEEPECS